MARAARIRVGRAPAAAREFGKAGQPVARPGDEMLLPPHVSRVGIPLAFVCLSPLCSPSSQALLSCQLGFLPPPQLFLYIWSQEGELELPHREWDLQLCSWLSRKELQP